MDTELHEQMKAKIMEAIGIGARLCTVDAAPIVRQAIEDLRRAAAAIADRKAALTVSARAPERKASPSEVLVDIQAKRARYDRPRRLGPFGRGEL